VSAPRRLLVVGLFGGLLVAPVHGRAQEVKIDADTIGGLEARSIGPAAMSGRIAALDAVEGERLTLWVGAASGGVWKSTDGGLQFKPVFDKHTQSIGAVKIDPKDPKVVWVGTGESWVRNSVSYGDGVYKTTDGGDNWLHLGLEKTERIARIVIDPKDTGTVFVCATGPAFAPSPDRGVYRTKDGGKTWEKVLFVNDDTGCADVAIDPQDGRILYAGMWQFRRRAWTFASGGPGSGLFKSTDGGSTWRKVQNGLPKADLGRIALAVSPARPSVVYATVEAREATALYRSDDLGETWVKTNSTSAVSTRPFYFSHLVSDPKDWNRVYKPGFLLAVSDDGGKTFSSLGVGGSIFGASYHPDCHALWINPRDTDQLVLGTDGGVFVSEDRGARWRFVASLPVSQFYHVSYDLQWPYYVYGGLQDNSTWYGPSRRAGPIGNKHWSSLAPGDGFWAFVDPQDPDVVYNEIQGGNLYRMRKSTLETKDIRPSPPKAGEPKYRFNWNTPIHLSPNEKGTIYYASQYLFRSRDQGDRWERISPDLTTNDPEKQKQDLSGGLTLDNSTAENHCTIFTVAESPRNKDLIWVGTDDGNLQLTRDGGKSWTNVIANVPALPRNSWVTTVEASRFAEGAAYATFDRHYDGDFKTYLYKTTDFGRTWTSLSTADLEGYAHVVREDVENRDLLFLGTELGLFVSVDGGKQWARFTGNLPRVAVRDAVIHPRDHDLILATHGRGIHIVDDITPLRKLTSEVVQREVAFLESRPSPMVIPAFEFDFSGDQEFLGQNPPEAAAIVYYLKKRHMIGDLKLEVYDSSGKLLSTVPGGKRKGLNRVFWPMRLPPPKVPAAAGPIPSLFSFFGPRAPEATYTVKLIKGKDAFTTTVSLVADPRARHTAEDRKLQLETVRKLYDMMGRFTYTVEAVVDARDQLRSRAEKLAKGDGLRSRLERAAEAFEKQRAGLVATKESEGISGEEKLREELGTLYGNVNGYDGRPTRSQLDRMAVFEKQLEEARQAFEATAEREFAALKASLAARKLEPLVKLSEEAWATRHR
jgi:photosystem II stability/assembly factor-like uncharacterized protein